MMRRMKPTPLNIKDLLLAPKLDDEQVAALLTPFGIREYKKADMNLQLISCDPVERLIFSEFLEEALMAFSESPNPDQALNNFERFCKTTFSKTHFFSYLQASPRTLHQLAFVFGASPFLSDVLIRNPEYFYWIFSPEGLRLPKGKSDYRKELRASLGLVKSQSSRLDMLRIFKRKEILRIGVRDLLREASVERTLRELSNLADVLIEQAYAICERALRQTFGKPVDESDASKARASGFTVIALGKLGSRELNFSSDVDLIYLYASGKGETKGQKGKARMGRTRYYERLAQEITAALNERTEQGYVYRVDLRLRPEGDAGAIALPMEGYRRYYKNRGEIWERLALLRARLVAGDRSLGRAFLDLAGDFVYSPFGPEGFAEVRDCKVKIDESIATDDLEYRDVKRGYGGIREIEFIAQSLVLSFCSSDLRFRKVNTIDALRWMAKEAQLAKASETDLRKAYLFLRDVENKLQMENDRQTHLIPGDPSQRQSLARSLGYLDQGQKTAEAQLKADLNFNTERVHRIFQAIFYPQSPGAK